MGDVKDKVTIIGREIKEGVDALFDSGATFSQLDETVAKEARIVMLGKKITQTLGDNSEVQSELGFGIIRIKDCNIPTLFAVLPKGIHKVIIGQNVMQPYGVKLDLEKETYEIRCPVPRA